MTDAWRVTHSRRFRFACTNVLLGGVYLALGLSFAWALLEALRAFPGWGTVLGMLAGFFTLGLLLLYLGVGALLDLLGAERRLEGPVTKKRSSWRGLELEVSGTWVSTDAHAFESVQVEDVVLVRCGRFLSELKSLARQQ